MSAAYELADALMYKLRTQDAGSLSDEKLKELQLALNKERLRREVERPVSFPQLENI